jgi:hypothetical protein
MYKKAAHVVNPRPRPTSRSHRFGYGSTRSEAATGLRAAGARRSEEDRVFTYAIHKAGRQVRRYPQILN